MNNIKRYTLEIDPMTVRKEIFENLNGEFVKWEDVKDYINYYNNIGDARKRLEDIWNKYEQTS